MKSNNIFKLFLGASVAVSLYLMPQDHAYAQEEKEAGPAVEMPAAPTLGSQSTEADQSGPTVEMPAAPTLGSQSTEADQSGPAVEMPAAPTPGSQSTEDDQSGPTVEMPAAPKLGDESGGTDDGSPGLSFPELPALEMPKPEDLKLVSPDVPGLPTVTSPSHSDLALASGSVLGSVSAEDLLAGLAPGLTGMHSQVTATLPGTTELSRRLPTVEVGDGLGSLNQGLSLPDLLGSLQAEGLTFPELNASGLAPTYSIEDLVALLKAGQDEQAAEVTLPQASAGMSFGPGWLIIAVLIGGTVSLAFLSLLRRRSEIEEPAAT